MTDKKLIETEFNNKIEENKEDEILIEILKVCKEILIQVHCSGETSPSQ